MNIPEKIKTLFASATGALKSIIPETGTVDDTEASMQMGFPPRTMSQGADKTPPTGQDMNGILYKITEAIRYLQAGGIYAYDNNFVQAIGGYPLGSILISADGSKLWQNQVAGNTNNPDVDSTNWLELCTVSALTAGLSTKQGTLTFDTTPTANSSNPVTSDGIADALDGKLDTSGGTMTGELTFNRTGSLIRRYGDNPIFGIDATNNQIYVASTDGTKYLRLGDGGEILWAGIRMSAMSLPSGTTKAFTLPASQGTYTAPADGWIGIRKKATAVGQYIRINVNGVLARVSAVTATEDVEITFPVKKGASVFFAYNLAGTTSICNFVYAEGAVWEA